jgi:putative FmdB family regulatory protein
MDILNDYRCQSCGEMAEHWTPRPAPSLMTCHFCGGDARKLFAAPRLGGKAQAPKATSSNPRPSMCSQYPMVPGLCHMSEDAGRMWVAKYKGDNRAVEREIAYQETKVKERPFTTEDAISHSHHPGGSTLAPDPAP